MLGFSSALKTMAFSGWIKIETNNFVRLTGKLRISTHAPTLAPIQMQVVLAHDTPDSIIADITQSFGNQPAIPACKSLRRRFG